MEKLENLTEDEKIILRDIYFYYNSLGSNRVKKLGVKSIKYKNNVVHLLLTYPGVFIGKKGKDIEYITKVVRDRLHNPKLEFNLETSSIDSYLLDLNN